MARKAPSASATLFKRGTVKRGNDGNQWRIVADSRGVQRWQKVLSRDSKHIAKNKTLKHNKSNRVLNMEVDQTTVWGKNKPLERFWQDLASGKNVVIIYKNSRHKIENVPKGKVALRTFYDNLDDDPDVDAVLSSNMSQDAYEVYLYPKAKDKSVNDVIKHYKFFFKSSGPMPADLIEKGIPAQKKVLYPS